MVFLLYNSRLQVIGKIQGGKGWLRNKRSMFKRVAMASRDMRLEAGGMCRVLHLNDLEPEL
jgi:hypothetical protein